MKKQILLCLAAIIFTADVALAQPLSFSQPFANPLYLNPAFAGTSDNQRIGLNLRDQWVNFPGNPITYSAFYDRDIIDSNFGIGVLADGTSLGFMSSTNASLILSYKLHIKSFTLSAGVQGGFFEKTLNGENLVFGSQIATGQAFTYVIPYTSHVMVPDFSAGLLRYGKNYFIGFALDHITQPNQSFSGAPSPLPLKLMLHGGVLIHAGEVSISPTLLFLKQQDINEAMLQCYITYKSFIGGIGNIYNVNTFTEANAQSYHANAITFILGYQNKSFRITYSYDYSTSPDNWAGGTHEVSVGFFIHYKSTKLKKQSGLNFPML